MNIRVLINTPKRWQPYLWSDTQKCNTHLANPWRWSQKLAAQVAPQLKKCKVQGNFVCINICVLINTPKHCQPYHCSDTQKYNTWSTQVAPQFETVAYAIRLPCYLLYCHKMGNKLDTQTIHWSTLEAEGGNWLPMSHHNWKWLHTQFVSLPKQLLLVVLP